MNKYLSIITKKQLFIMVTFVVAVVGNMFAVDYWLILFHKNGNNIYNVTDIDSITFNKDSLAICQINDIFARRDIDSIILVKNLSDDTLRINWEKDNVTISNPLASECKVINNCCSLKILYSGIDKLNISVQGYSDKGSLTVESKSPVSITSNGLYLSNSKREAINVSSKETTFNILGKTTLNDSSTRDSLSSNKACLYNKGTLKIIGNDTLIVAGNYKNAIQSSKEIKINAPIQISNAISDGFKCKNLMSIDGGKILARNIGNNAISVENGNFIFNGGIIDIVLESIGSKGVKADSEYVQTGGRLSLRLLANQSKGIKAHKGVELRGGVIEGRATGSVVVVDGDPSYCTFIKSDSDITVSNTFLSLNHGGHGGKCLSADHDMTLLHSEIDATLSGKGGNYVNTDGEQDYYTPRVIEANNNLKIYSGLYDFHCEGNGGKGIVCDHSLTIGEVEGNDDLLTINITTEGSCLVDNTIEDYREGCPKAIKSMDSVNVLSGRITLKTFGTGGEGIEGKNCINIKGGYIHSDTYDDSFNGGNDINVYGGDIVCKSLCNDGIDSNGSIHIYGGDILAITEDNINESIDSENHNLYVYGGNVFGVGNGDVIPKVSTIPFYNYPKFIGGIKPSPKINFEKDKYISVCKDGKAIISIKNGYNIYGATTTVATPLLIENEQYYFSECDEIENPDYPLIDNSMWCGGKPINETKKLDFRPHCYF